MGKVADQYLQIDPWKLIEIGFHAEHSRVSESLFSLGNEHQGVRGYFDEGYSGDTLIGCYLNGLYEEHFLKEPMSYKGISNRIAFMVNTVDWLHTRLELDGEVLDLNRSKFSDFRRELDFRTGELRRGFTWHTLSGKSLRVTLARFLSMQVKELGFQRITLTPIDFSGPITITLGLDFSIVHEIYAENFWNCPRKETKADRCAILGISNHIRQQLFAGFQMMSDATQSYEALQADRFVGGRYSIELAAGRTSIIDRRSVLYTDRDPLANPIDTWAHGEQLLDRAATYDQALQGNCTYWHAYWDKFDIVIEGDVANQQGIRFCLFQLQQTYRGVVPGSNIGAKGLTGEAYNGNAFWDTETYCLSYYLFSNPPAARALLEYRYKTLPQALERARQLDCAGACFPIATSDGTESCTMWQHASLQFQPTTAVAYGIWHYVKITHDQEFLRAHGVELLVQICRFLASRGQWSPRRNQFGYYAVMGPDEFQAMVNNNAYTNTMAKRTFEYTLAVMATMPDRQTALGCAPDELAAWRSMAANMIIPYDATTGLYEQHEGFFDLPHIDVDAIPVEDFPLYHHWSYDRIYRNDMIKQPDVLMFMFLYNQSFSLAEKRVNYDYYEPRCIHESSLSPSVHSIFAAELGRAQEAFDFFQFATRIDLDNYNRNTAEGIHMTSIAAAWMNIVYGFGGMRSDGERLVFNPTIPAHWKSYRFQVLYGGSLLRVTVTQDHAHFQVVEGEPVEVVIRGQVQKIDQHGLTLPHMTA